MHGASLLEGWVTAFRERILHTNTTVSKEVWVKQGQQNQYMHKLEYQTPVLGSSVATSSLTTFLSSKVVLFLLIK